ncbi:response regulator transcription factor [Allokutzneria sp. A3M-2-11 16]|uniref:response regulator n=1 Tax=Allokutzneria sp. A3M-2-11 16 TaxID=2962043 RepID=UPI0020B63A30|nr:response regulator transcription factor [Allokutzneria sp. A3M-2-11 16]MCP3805580.1 response regulator transcription factor [Allokutzneria sp. A3M-2-11 16]
MIRLLIADDSLISRMGLRLMFENVAGFEVIGEAASGGETVEATHRLRPDVLLLDIRMPGGNGNEVARRLAGSATRILVLSTFDDEEYVHGALRAGVDGFLLKDASREEILAAVRSVAAGEARLAPSVTRKVLDVVDLPEPDARIAALSGREIELLRLLAEGLTNAEIAGRLGVTPGSAKTYVSQLLGKLGARDRVAAVVLAHRGGLMRQP